MAIWIMNTREFKENITIKSGWNVRSILNPKCIVIQFFQLQGGMGGKRLCLKAIHDTKKIRGELQSNLSKGCEQNMLES
jgi:hypothetical protein